MYLSSHSHSKIVQIQIRLGYNLFFLRQGQSTPLPDAICWIIARLKQNDVSADMTVILESLAAEFPDITRPANFKEVIHQTLGGLIKQRKVYYTGKGYFLVTPDGAATTAASMSTRTPRTDSRAT